MALQTIKLYISNPDIDLIRGYENSDYYTMKPTEHVLFHSICVLCHLSRACKRFLCLYYWTHCCCWWIYHL